MITIIVPIFNSERYLERCLSSIIMQKYTDLEIILVDDASEDSSLLICNNFKKKDARITVLMNENNEGQAYSYVKALEIAQGDYIGFVDSDDWIDESMYEILFDAIELHDADMAVCGCYKVFLKIKLEEPENIATIGTRIFSNTDIRQECSRMHMQENQINDLLKMYRWNKLIKREVVFKNIKYVDKSIKVFEDNNFILPCLLDCKKIIYLNQCLYYYYQHENSTMRKFDPNIIISNRNFLVQQNKIFQEKQIPFNIAQNALFCCIFTLGKLSTMVQNKNEKKDMLKEISNDIKKYGISLRLCLLSRFGIKEKLAIILIKYHWFSLFIMFSNFNNAIKIKESDK